jgi:hypothetical protein
MDLLGDEKMNPLFHRLTLLSRILAFLSFPLMILAQNAPNKAGRIVNSATEPAAVSSHERFATFLAGQDFKSQLLIENLRLDVPLTVTPALITRRGEIPLKQVTLSPHSTTSVDINAALQEHEMPDTRGVVVVRYNFSTYGALSAVVTSTDETHWLYRNSVAQSREEFRDGTSLDAVIWAPEEDVQGFISLVNTSSESKAIQATFVINGRSEPLPPIEIAPRQFSFVPIDDLVARSRDHGAGIHLQFQGKPGDIVAEGTLLKKANGFVKYIRFMDTALKFPNPALWSNFLLLGRQPLADGFPATVAFRSVAVIRNVDTAPIELMPTVKYTRGPSVQTIRLQPITLNVGESRLIDFSKEQRAGSLPADFAQGTLKLTPNAQHTAIVSELFNFDEKTGGYVVGSSFTAHPSRAVGSIWQTDGTFQTTIAIENTANEADAVKLTLFSESGTYEKTFPIAAGNLLKINLRELQQNSILDDSGHKLTATSGALSIAGARGVSSALTFDKLIHSANTAEYVGLLAQPCNFVTSIGGFLDGGQNPFAIMVNQFWTDGSITTNPATLTQTSNNSLVSISNNGNGDMATINVSNNGQPQTVNLFFQQTTTICDICSGDTLNSTTPVTIPVPDHLVVLSDSTQTQNCGSNPSTLFRQIKYEIQDQNNSQLLTAIGMRENVPTTVSSCNENIVSTGASCTLNTSFFPGVLSEFTDFLSPGCPNSSTNSPCGYTFAKQQWQWCPSSAPPQSMGTIGPVKAQNTLINVDGNVFLTPGTVFPK